MISKIYHDLSNKALTTTKRLEIISHAFLNKPYERGALGEGESAEFDQSPLYRTDAFDCETFIDTVLALTLAKNLHQFKNFINKIRYKNGQINFLYRNHFAELDWNQNNHQYLTDITTTFFNEKQELIAKFAITIINKPSWYQHLTINHIKINNIINNYDRQQLLTKLHNLSNQLPISTATTPYLPFTQLFDQNGHANQFIFNQIPNGAIIEIVRPNWELKNVIGTNLNISHMGLIIKKNHQLFIRHASTITNTVTDMDLIDYLAQARLNNTIKGINIHVVNPEFIYSSI